MTRPTPLGHGHLPAAGSPPRQVGDSAAAPGREAAMPRGPGPKQRGPVVAACDLDRTLIYSATALQLSATPEPPSPSVPSAPLEGFPRSAGHASTPSIPAGAEPRDALRLHCVEHYRGRPQSHLTATAAALLTELAERAIFVPATTRTREQYQRVRLPGRPPRYAVCANGGLLLVDGVSDPDWERHIARAVTAACAPLGEVRDTLDRLASRTDRTYRLHTAEELFCYLVTDAGPMPRSWVEELTDWAKPRGWTVSAQGRKVYLVPRLLTKSAAVSEVALRSGAAEILAAGDSLLDADLLEAADHGWRPGHGELAAAGWTAAGVTALTSRGVSCAEEILRGMLHRTPASPHGRHSSQPCGGGLLGP